jgi:hypothetical protein
MTTTTKIQFDWEPVVRSLFHHVQRANFAIITVHDGEERHPFSPDAGLLAVRNHAAKAVCAVDEAIVTVLDLEALNPRKLQLFLVLGNEAHETVNDHSLDPRLEAALDAFSTQWLDRKVPTKTA